MDNKFESIIGSDDLTEHAPPFIGLDEQLPSLDEQLEGDRQHIQSNLAALKRIKLRVKCKDLLSFERDHNRCCALYKNIIQLVKDAFAKYDTKVYINFSSMNLSLNCYTARNIQYLNIDQLKSIAQSANDIAGKCFLLILTILFICGPIIYTIAALIWSTVNIILWSVNRHAYHQMFAPVSQSMPHLNWCGAAFLLLALPFILASIISLVIAIKALCKKKECRQTLEHYHYIHQTGVFKARLADEILTSEYFEKEDVNKEIPNLIVSYL